MLQEARNYLGRWQNQQAADLLGKLGQVCDPSEVPEGLRLELASAKGQMPVSPAAAENEALIRLIFGASADLRFRSCEIGAERRPARLAFLESMTKKEYLMAVLETLAVRLRDEPMPSGGTALVQFLERRATASVEAAPVATLGDGLKFLLDGNSLLMVEGLTEMLGLTTQGWDHRAPDEPVTEPVVRGPKEGFTETLSTNIALVRRRLRDERLRVEEQKIGTRSATAVSLVYISGLALPDLVAEARRRLGRIEIDAVIESGYIEEWIEDNPYSPFPQVKQTERPDVVAAELLEGKVAILTDGTPHALVVPTTFFGEMQAAEDYYQRWPMTSFVRALRYLYLLLALLGPSSYVAITTYHHEMLPTNLLLSLIAAREGVPFPALAEALLMELTLEVLREAGLRLPKPVGQAISIVGALVIGDSAVRAGIVSPVMVIVVSATAISSFIIPLYSTALAIRVLRFGMMLLAGSFGFFGITLGLLVMVIHLTSLRSFGVPYLSPIAPPTLADWKDVLIRVPHWLQRRRPKYMPVPDRERQRGGRASQNPGAAPNARPGEGES